ncbi:MAG: 3-phosphoshikimate 1-carboxyvinyltransferase [Bacteroidota bacterium]|jgi:3-phosphoshikimate 1-carboxyvinyltransferase
MPSIFINHPTKIINGTVKVPSSKSISNRALILQHLFGDETVTISNVSEAKDTQLLIDCLDQLTFHKKSSSSNYKSAFVVDAWNAGTAFRFLTALLAITPGKWILTGDNRMHQRPIKTLVDALIFLGANISYIEKKGYPPLQIIGTEIYGGHVSMNTQQSSQFVNAMLLIAPTFAKGLTIQLEANPVSESYIDNTIGVLKMFGVECYKQGNYLEVKSTKSINKNYDVESDWSSIAFFVEIAALSNEANIIIENIAAKSIQGDYIICQIAENYGVECVFENNNLVIKKNKNSAAKKKEIFEFDFRSTPDLTQPVAAMSAGLGIDTFFKGIDHLALKETDRIKALENELHKINVQFTRKNDFHILKNPKEIEPISSISFNTYNDHRMAMSLAPMCLKLGQIEIKDPLVVEKSFPDFWAEMEKLGFETNYKK